MITSFPPAKDGVGDVTFELVKSLRNSGVHVFVISHTNGAKKQKDVHRLITQKKSKRGLYQIFREISSMALAVREAGDVADAIEKINPDIVHAQYEPGLYNLFFLPFLFKMLKSRGIKTFLTLHGRDYFPLTVFHRRMLYPLSDRIIVHNDTHKNLLPEEVREKVAVIPMGITKINGRFDKKSVKNFLFFGYASPYKGLEYLIEAFSKIHENFNDSKLFIHSPVNPIHSAEGEYQEKIDGLIDNLGLKDSTVFVRSYTKRELLPSIRAQTTVFPYKRSYSAGQSAALLDSIASGKAVIVTKVPGIFERVNDGETGLIVEPENVGMLQKAMENLLENPKLVERMSRNNLRLAKDLSWKNIAKRTLRLYKE